MFCRSSIVRSIMSTSTNDALRRHLPRQQRARERVESLLDAAEQLIAEQGHAQLKLSAVAQRAQVPIGSFYQYFGGQGALLRALAERHMAGFAQRLDALLADAPASLEQTLAAVLQAYLDFYQEAETYQWVRAAAQGDPGLRELDLADSRANARRLLAQLPGVARADEASLFLACEMTGSFASLQADLRRQGASAAELRAMQAGFLKMLRALLIGDGVLPGVATLAD